MEVREVEGDSYLSTKRFKEFLNHWRHPTAYLSTVFPVLHLFVKTI